MFSDYIRPDFRTECNREPAETRCTSGLFEYSQSLRCRKGGTGRTQRGLRKMRPTTGEQGYNPAHGPFPKAGCGEARISHSGTATLKKGTARYQYRGGICL